jgi:hypothetical protein
MRRNKEKDIVPNTNIQEKESIKVVDVTSNSVGLLIQNWPLYFRSEILKGLEESNKYAPNFFLLFRELVDL